MKEGDFADDEDLHIPKCIHLVYAADKKPWFTPAMLFYVKI